MLEAAVASGEMNYVQARAAREHQAGPKLLFLGLLRSRAWIDLRPGAGQGSRHTACVSSAPTQRGSWLSVGHIEQACLHFRDLPCPINFAS